MFPACARPLSEVKLGASRLLLVASDILIVCLCPLCLPLSQHATHVAVSCDEWREQVD